MGMRKANRHLVTWRNYYDVLENRGRHARTDKTSHPAIVPFDAVFWTPVNKYDTSLNKADLDGSLYTRTLTSIESHDILYEQAHGPRRLRPLRRPILSG
jgi:hypothetical protein